MYETAVQVATSAMSEVYRAQDKARGRPVALKYLRLPQAQYKKRFLREARAQSALDHPNICKVYEFGERAGTPFIAMQWVDGADLDEALGGHPLETRLRVFLDVLDAVQHAHSNGLIHRDLKPSNILVEEADDGHLHPWLMDFGLVREENSETLTQAGQILGTPAYMSPEQARGDFGTLDRRADIYALGVILFQLCTGQLPYEQHTDLELLMQVLRNDPRRPRDLAPQIAPGLERIIVQAMERRPMDRYQAVSDLTRDIRRFLKGESVTARRLGQLYWGKRALRKHRMAALAAGLALIPIAAISLYALDVSRDAGEQANQARRYGTQAADIENALDMAYMYPEAELGLVQSRILAQITALEDQVEDHEGIALGALQQALGRAYWKLGQSHKAREHLVLAWNNGLRDPEHAVQLGTVLAQIHGDERRQLQGIRDDFERDQRRQAIDLQWREPALTYFSIAARSGEVGWAAQVRSSMLRAEYEQAVALIQEVLQQSPSDLEAMLLAGQTHFALASEKLAQGETQAGLALLDTADAYFEHLLEIARSHPVAALERCRVLGRRISQLLASRIEVSPETIDTGSCQRATTLAPDNSAAWLELGFVRQSLALLKQRQGSAAGNFIVDALMAAQQAEQLDPLSADVQLLLGRILRVRSRLGWSDSADPEADMRQSINHLERALESRPRSADVLGLLALSWDDLSRLQMDWGQDAVPASEFAVDYARRKLALNPDIDAYQMDLGMYLGGLAQMRLEQGLETDPWLTEGLAILRGMSERMQSDTGYLFIVGLTLWTAVEDAAAAGGDVSSLVEETVHVFDKLLTVVPEDVDARINALGFHLLVAEYLLTENQAVGDHLEQVAAHLEKLPMATRTAEDIACVEAQFWLQKARWQQRMENADWRGDVQRSRAIADKVLEDHDELNCQIAVLGSEAVMLKGGQSTAVQATTLADAAASRFPGNPKAASGAARLYLLAGERESNGEWIARGRRQMAEAIQRSPSLAWRFPETGAFLP